MKNKLFLFAALLLGLAACNTVEIYEDNLGTPNISKLTTEAVNECSAILSATVTDDGGQWIYERGFLWAAQKFSPSSTTSATKVNMGQGKGTFTYELGALNPGTDYWACAYVETENGERTYTDVVKFSTVVSAAVEITGTQVGHACWYEYSSQYGFLIDLSLNMVKASDMTSVGVSYTVDGQTYRELLDATLVKEGQATLSPFFFSATGGEVTFTPYAWLSNGRQVYGTPVIVLLETKDIKGDLSVTSYYVDWYSDPDWNVYYHSFWLEQTLYSGAENVTKLGFYTDYDWQTLTWNNTSFTNDFLGSTSLSYTSTDANMSLYVTGIALYDNENGIYISGKQGSAASTYLSSYSFETFFYEPFSTESSKFSVYTPQTPAVGNAWAYDAEDGSMMVQASSNGVCSTCESWLITKELDLTNRSSAYFDFECLFDGFTDLLNQAVLKVTTDGGSTWTDLPNPELAEHNDNSWNAYEIDLTLWLGNKVQLAFVYYSDESGAGLCRIDNANVYSVTPAGTTAAAPQRGLTNQSEKPVRVALPDSRTATVRPVCSPLLQSDEKTNILHSRYEKASR